MVRWTFLLSMLLLALSSLACDKHIREARSASPLPNAASAVIDA